MEKEELNEKVKSIKKSMDSYRKKDAEAKRRAESFRAQVEEDSPLIDDTVQEELEPCYPDYQTEYYNLLALLRSANVCFEKIDGERFVTLRYKDCEQCKNPYIDQILDIVKEN